MYSRHFLIYSAIFHLHKLKYYVNIYLFFKTKLSIEMEDFTTVMQVSKGKALEKFKFNNYVYTIQK